MSTECCVTRAVLQRFVVVAIREVPSAVGGCGNLLFPSSGVGAFGCHQVHREPPLG